jgi:hypothetical protein
LRKKNSTTTERRRPAGSGADSRIAGDHRCGLMARMVEPIAPYLAALRRVSSNAERA